MQRLAFYYLMYLYSMILESWLCFWESTTNFFQIILFSARPFSKYKAPIEYFKPQSTQRAQRKWNLEKRGLKIQSQVGLQVIYPNFECHFFQ